MKICYPGKTGSMAPDNTLLRMQSRGQGCVVPWSSQTSSGKGLQDLVDRRSPWIKGKRYGRNRDGGSQAEAGGELALHVHILSRLFGDE